MSCNIWAPAQGKNGLFMYGDSHCEDEAVVRHFERKVNKIVSHEHQLHDIAKKRYLQDCVTKWVYVSPGAIFIYCL